MPTVTLYKWELNRGDGSWREIKHSKTTIEKINSEILKHLDINPDPMKYFYKFETFDADGNPQGVIFTLNPGLFDQ